jgi:integrase
MLIASAAGTPVTVQAWRSAWESYVTEMETAINGCSERWYGEKREHQGKELPPFIRFTVKPYDLRHSFCTWCRDNGVEINTCVHWMGHADAKMILQIYDEFSTERSKSEAEKLKKSLFQVQTEVQAKE